MVQFTLKQTVTAPDVLENGCIPLSALGYTAKAVLAFALGITIVKSCAIHM